MLVHNHLRRPPARPLKMASAATALIIALICGVPMEAHGSRHGKAELQRDLDAITALGLTGAQARAVSSTGRASIVVSGEAEVGTGRPVPRNGYFRIASATKPLVATAVLQLVGEGRLSLDDTVDQHLPGVVRGTGAGHEIDGRTITIRQLLQNTSGLLDDYPGFDSEEEYLEHRFDAYSRMELIKRTMAVAPAFAPGEGWA